MNKIYIYAENRTWVQSASATFVLFKLPPPTYSLEPGNSVPCLSYNFPVLDIKSIESAEIRSEVAVDRRAFLNEWAGQGREH